jgi:hypothetical protein
MEPRVVHLILCDNARVDAHNFHRLDIRGVLVRLRARRDLPIRQDFCFVAMFEGFRGVGRLRFRIVEHATGRRVAESAGHSVTFPRDPSEVVTFVLHLRKCPLPKLGRYRVELLDGPLLLDERPFWLLPQE